jgi:hypothetical protein
MLHCVQIVLKELGFKGVHWIYVAQNMDKADSYENRIETSGSTENGEILYHVSTCSVSFSRIKYAPWC